MVAIRRSRRLTAKGGEVRARIVAEATRVFSRDGYRSGSLAAIAEAAGLTQQGLLHHFPSKAALLLAVVEDRDARTAAFIAEREGPGTPVEEFVEGVRHNAEEPHLVELMTVLSAESVSPDHPTHSWFVERYDQLVDRLASAIQREQEAGTWASGDPVQIARVLVALADGLRLQRLLGHPELDHADILANVVRSVRTTSNLAE